MLRWFIILGTLLSLFPPCPGSGGCVLGSACASHHYPDRKPGTYGGHPELHPGEAHHPRSGGSQGLPLGTQLVRSDWGVGQPEPRPLGFLGGVPSRSQPEPELEKYTNPTRSAPGRKVHPQLRPTGTAGRVCSLRISLEQTCELGVCQQLER